MTDRFAIYWTPEPLGPMAAFGAAWFGRDPAQDRDVPRLALPRITAPRHDAATSQPRRYGFHATLKPPFALAAGADLGVLQKRLAAFANATAPLAAPALHLADLKGFLALVPSEAWPAIHGLADATVEQFDDLRAPPLAAELSQRRSGGLSARQDRYLERWGYPYVFEEFQFHITLTERLDDQDRALFSDVLAPLVAPFCAAPWRLDAISLLRQAAPGVPFALVRRFPLRGRKP